MVASEPPPSSPPHENTAVLLTSIRAGDELAKDRLFAQVLPVLRRWAHRRLPARSRGVRETEDLVQDTLLRAFRHLDTFECRGEGAFLAYLRRILLNVVRDEARRHGTRPEQEPFQDQMAGQEASPIERVIGRDQLERFERALEKLPEEQHQAVILRVEFGYSHQQIAEAIGKPTANAARMTVTRALVELAKALDEP